MLHAGVDVSSFQADKSEGNVALSCHDVVVAELLLKKALDDIQVLDGLMVVVLVDR